MKISIKNGNISLEDNNGNVQQVQQSTPKKKRSILGKIAKTSGLVILGGLAAATVVDASGMAGLSHGENKAISDAQNLIRNNPKLNDISKTAINQHLKLGNRITYESAEVSQEDNNGNVPQQSAPKKSHKKLIAGLCILGGLGVASYIGASNAAYNNTNSSFQLWAGKNTGYFGKTALGLGGTKNSYNFVDQLEKAKKR